LEKFQYQPRGNSEKYERRMKELRHSLRLINPHTLAHRTKTEFEKTNHHGGVFKFSYWGHPIMLTFPDLVSSHISEKPLSSEALPLLDQIVILYYFYTADGVPQADKWIAFSELIEGRFYDAAFQSYTSQLLMVNFQNQQNLFSRTALKIGGQHTDFADSAFIFQILPRVPLLSAYWEGDEDFPTSIRILFDASANHYLPTDGYAILGSFLTHKLINAKKIHQKQ